MPTTTRAAVLWGHHEDWKIEEVELDDPGHGEVLVKTSYAGMCHSDEHVVQGDMPDLPGRQPELCQDGGHHEEGEDQGQSAGLHGRKCTSCITIAARGVCLPLTSRPWWPT